MAMAHLSWSIEMSEIDNGMGRSDNIARVMARGNGWTRSGRGGTIESDPTTQLIMRSKSLLTLLLLLLLLTCGGMAFAEEADQYFPLEKGHYWIYKGETKWVQKNPATDENEVKSKILTWRTEVVDSTSRGNVYAALLKGFPSDLAWYQPAEKREDHLIVRVGSCAYHLFDGDSALKAWATIKDESKSLDDLVNGDSLLIDAPLAEGKVYGNFTYTTRGMYCWIVEHGEPNFDASRINGIRPKPNMESFDVAFRTNPSHIIFKFVPGVGIIHYVYVHHGTVSETDLSLIETGHLR